MKLEPCISLSFDGNCEAAFDFYERNLGGKVAFKLTWGDSPMANEVPPEWRGKLLYARLILGDTALHGADAVPGTYKAPRASVSISASTAPRTPSACLTRSRRKEPLTCPFKRPFGRTASVVTDQFRIPWEIQCEKLP